MERLEAQPDAISERERFTKYGTGTSCLKVPSVYRSVWYSISVSMRITRCAENKTDKNVSQVPAQKTKEVENDIEIYGKA